MSDSVNISSRTVSFWKSRGFTFTPTPGVVGCTGVSLGGKPFHYFLTRRVGTSEQLLRDLNTEVSQAPYNVLVATGEYGDDDLFPWFLVTQESLEEMQRARHRYCAAMHDAQKYLGDFSGALFDGESQSG
jgi:hypothetical protein